MGFFVCEITNTFVVNRFEERFGDWLTDTINTADQAGVDETRAFKGAVTATTREFVPGLWTDLKLTPTLKPLLLKKDVALTSYALFREIKEIEASHEVFFGSHPHTRPSHLLFAFFRSSFSCSTTSSFEP